MSPPPKKHSLFCLEKKYWYNGLSLKTNACVLNLIQDLNFRLSIQAKAKIAERWKGGLRLGALKQMYLKKIGSYAAS